MTQIGAHAQNAFHYLCRRNACAAMNFHCLMVNWNPVTALPITPTLEQFVSTLLCLKQAILGFEVQTLQRKSSRCVN